MRQPGVEPGQRAWEARILATILLAREINHIFELIKVYILVRCIFLMPENLEVTCSRCINQVFRPTLQIPSYARPENTGDCTVCTADKRNGYCQSYNPIRVFSASETSILQPAPT